MRCADCGRTVERGRNRRWGSPIGGGYALSYACRTVVEDGVLLRADYHYVDGEKQQHYPTVLDTVTRR
jgi:hypothetical protein